MAGQVTIDDEGPHVTLTLDGEIDIETCVDHLPRVLAYDGRDVTIDVGKVTFIDSSGLGLLIKLRRRADDSGGTVHLVNQPPCVAKLLEMSGLADFFDAA
jgi:anti-sigma B factor antagonist